MREMIGHYKVIAELGRGGMGSVYKAHEMSLNRTVAVKVLAEPLSKDPIYVSRFVREAQSAAALNHPNAVNIFFIGEDQGLHYYTMEYVDGESVKDLIEREGALSPKRALPLIRQALAGLIAAHQIGLVHRDIKPANIMITREGVVKLADFGLAVRPDVDSKLTATGMFVGTPGYLAPEQCMGEEADARADIYSMGVTLYEMLTGKPAFSGDSVLAILHKVTQSEPLDARQLNPQIDAQAFQILQNMMAKQKDLRYQTSDEVAAAIDDYLAGATVAVPAVGAPVADQMEATELMPTPPPVPMVAPARRSSGLGLGAVFGGILAVLLVAAVIGFSVWKFWPTSTNAMDPAAASQVISQSDQEPDTAEPVLDDHDADTEGDPVSSFEAEQTSSDGNSDAPNAPATDQNLLAQKARTASNPPDESEGQQLSNETPVESKPLAVAKIEGQETERNHKEDDKPVKTRWLSDDDRIAVVYAGDRLLGEALRDRVFASLQDHVDVVDERLDPELERVVEGHRDAADLLQKLDPRGVNAVVYIDVELLSERTLTYMNRRQPAWTAQVTIRFLDAVEPARNQVLWSDRSEYTEISVERVADQIERKCRRQMRQRAKRQ